MYTLSGFLSFFPTGACFLIPIFQTPESNESFAQEIDREGKIAGFRAIAPTQYFQDPTSLSRLARTLGNNGVFAARLSDGEIVCGSYQEFEAKLRKLNLKERGSAFFNVDALSLLGNSAARDAAIDSAVALFSDEEVGKRWAAREKLNQFPGLSYPSHETRNIELLNEGVLGYPLQDASWLIMTFGRRSRQVIGGLLRHAKSYHIANEQDFQAAIQLVSSVKTSEESSPRKRERRFLLIFDANQVDLQALSNRIARKPKSSTTYCVAIFQPNLGVPTVDLAELQARITSRLFVLTDSRIPNSDSGRTTRLGETALSLLRTFEVLEEKDVSLPHGVSLFCTGVSREGADGILAALKLAISCGANPWVMPTVRSEAFVVGQSVGRPKMDNRIVGTVISELFGFGFVGQALWLYQPRQFLVGAHIAAKVSLLLANVEQPKNPQQAFSNAAKTVLRTKGFEIRDREGDIDASQGSFYAQPPPTPGDLNAGRPLLVRLRHEPTTGIYVCSDRKEQLSLLHQDEPREEIGNWQGQNPSEAWPLLYPELFYFESENFEWTGDLLAAFSHTRADWNRALAKILGPRLRPKLTRSPRLELFGRNVADVRITSFKTAVTHIKRRQALQVEAFGIVSVHAEVFTRNRMRKEDTFHLAFTAEISPSGVSFPRIG
ncbi:MAG: hypothetical protein ACJ8IR_13810 [Alphaproteobacteria bacterium]